MKLYKLDAFYQHIGTIYAPLSVTRDCYFESLHAALGHLTMYCHLGLPWAISLYSGFQFIRYVARGRYD